MAELVMKEYGFKSVVEVLKSFTIPQISQHLQWMEKRRRQELQELLSIYHAQNPKKLYQELQYKGDILKKLQKYREEKRGHAG